MPITFSCECGKSFTVGEKFAGKRTKCPVCSAGLTVPDPSTPGESTAEDEAFRMLDDGSGPDPMTRPARLDWAGQVEPTPPPPIPSQPPSRPAGTRSRAPKVRGQIRSVWGEEERGGGFRISLSPAVAGGLASMVIAGIIIAIAIESDRIPIGAVVVFVFGLVAVVKGVLGYSED